MSVASATATDTLLDYTVTTNPDPIQVSPESGDPSLATLVVVVSNPQSDAVRVQKIELSFDIGDKDDPDATYLTDIGEGIHTRSSSPDWSLPTSADGSFVVTPQGDPEISSQGLTFTLSHIVVNPIVGTFELRIAETAEIAGDAQQPLKTRRKTVKIAKFPYGFWVGELTTQTPNVAHDGTAILTWSGSDNATYTMLWPDKPDGEDVTARRSWTTPPIHEPTTFQLKVVAQSGQGETVEHDRYLPIMVIEPRMPRFVNAAASANAVYQGDTVTLTWHTEDADYCTLDPDPLHRRLPATGTSTSVTVSPDRKTRYTLRCFGSGQSDSRDFDVDVYGWIAVASMPTARHALAAATGSDGRVYAIGGWARGSVLGVVEAYDPKANSWAPVAGIQARYWLAAASAPDGRVYAIGGFASGGPTPVATVQVYDPKNPQRGWVTVAPMSTARGLHAATLGPDGRIYAIGGVADRNTVLNTVEAYDPKADRWTTAPSLASPTCMHAATLGPDGRMYAIGSNTAATATPTVQWYDPRNPGSGWSTDVPQLPTRRGGLAAATGSDGQIYAIAGATMPDQIALTVVQAYDPDDPAGGWTGAGSLTPARYLLAAAVAHDGTLYAIGGRGLDDMPMATVERPVLLDGS